MEGQVVDANNTRTRYAMDGCAQIETKKKRHANPTYVFSRYVALVVVLVVVAPRNLHTGSTHDLCIIGELVFFFNIHPCILRLSSHQLFAHCRKSA